MKCKAVVVPEEFALTALGTNTDGMRMTWHEIDENFVAVYGKKMPPVKVFGQRI